MSLGSSTIDLAVSLLEHPDRFFTYGEGLQRPATVRAQISSRSRGSTSHGSKENFTSSDKFLDCFFPPLDKNRSSEYTYNSGSRLVGASASVNGNELQGFHFPGLQGFTYGEEGSQRANEYRNSGSYGYEKFQNGTDGGSQQLADAKHLLEFELLKQLEYKLQQYRPHEYKVKPEYEEGFDQLTNANGLSSTFGFVEKTLFPRDFTESSERGHLVISLEIIKFLEDFGAQQKQTTAREYHGPASHSAAPSSDQENIGYGYPMATVQGFVPNDHNRGIPTQRAQHRNIKDKYRVLKSAKRKSTKQKRKFDYSEISVPHKVVDGSHLQNNAVNETASDSITKAFQNQLLHLLDQSGCIIDRTRYHRCNISAIVGAHPDVIYERNPLFSPSHPYQQEFTRVELDSNTKEPIIETRSALCAYCEQLSFFELKNSCYSQHMSHLHGIYTDDYLTPNPLHIGEYHLAKKDNPNRKTRPRIRCHEGVVCPACYEVVEIRCWTSTLVKNPLSNYLRHFKEHHRIDRRRDSFFNLHL